MQPRLLSPGAEGVIQTVPEKDGGDGTLLESLVGNSAVQAARRVIALGAITGSILAIGPFTAETANADSSGSTPAATLVTGPHQRIHEHQLSEERASTASSHTGQGSLHIKMAAHSASPHQATLTHHERSKSSNTGRAENECTDIVPFPGGYYYGKACSDNSVVIPLGESKSDNFYYAMLIVDGVYKHGVFKGGTYKCGYVKKGIIPTDHSPHKSADYCRQIAKRRILDPHTYLKDLSCDPGYCSGGTPTAPSPDCRPAVTFYANFTSATRSPFNVYPDGQSGFVQPEGEQPGTIGYRATVKPTSQFGPAAIVYGTKVDWGLTLQGCVPVQVLINSHNTNNSPPIKLSASLLESEVATNSPLAATPTL